MAMYQRSRVKMIDASQSVQVEKRYLGCKTMGIGVNGKQKYEIGDIGR